MNLAHADLRQIDTSELVLTSTTYPRRDRHRDNRVSRMTKNATEPTQTRYWKLSCISGLKDIPVLARSLPLLSLSLSLLPFPHSLPHLRDGIESRVTLAGNRLKGITIRTIGRKEQGRRVRRRYFVDSYSVVVDKLGRVPRQCARAHR